MKLDCIINILSNIIKKSTNIIITENMMNLKNIINEKFYDDNEFIYIDDNFINIKITKLLGEEDTKVCFESSDDNYVIKEDKYTNINACLSEFLFWNIIKNTKKEDYFAPCIAISKTFNSLIMKKVYFLNDDECEKHEKKHMEIKNFCRIIGYYETNSIQRNFGLLDDKLILCDYSMQTKYDSKFIYKLSSLLE